MKLTYIIYQLAMLYAIPFVFISGQTMCWIVSTLDGVGYPMMIVSLIIPLLNRFVALQHPAFYKDELSLKRVILFLCGIFFLSFLIIKVPLFAWIIPDGMCYAADTLATANPYQHQPEALNKVHLFLQAGGVYAFALLVVLIVLSLIANIAAYDHSLKKFQSDEGIQRNPERVKRNQRAILVELLFKTIGLIVFSSSIATLNFISFQKEEEESTVIKRDNAQIGQGCSTAADFCPFCISSTPH